MRMSDFSLCSVTSVEFRLFLCWYVFNIFNGGKSLKVNGSSFCCRVQSATD